MKIKYYLLMVLVFAMTFNACNKNEDDGPEIVPEIDRAGQQIEDKATLLTYLQTHYYNSGDLLGNLNPSISDLVITELAEGETLPVDHTFLIDDIETKTTILLETDYEYYILRLNQGGGEAPNFTDRVRLNYSGNTLDGEIFDSSINPVDFDLVALIPGWRRVIPQFNVSESFIENGDGTVSYTNSGVGVMFLPSGLGYYAAGATGISAYSSLVFKFEMFQTEVSDHDNDGLPSYIEDLNGNLNMVDDDTDGDVFNPNYVDADDDGDGVLTLNELEPNEHTINLGEPEPVLGAKEFEISRSEEAGVITIKTVTIKDSNNDGLDDYLDENITINYNEEG